MNKLINVHNLVRVVKKCDSRGNIGTIYEIIREEDHEYHLKNLDSDEYTFWHPKDCCEPVNPGAASIPSWAVNGKYKIKEELEVDPKFAATLDASNNLVDNPLDKEPDGVTAIPQEIKDICAVIWTTSIKNAWKAKLISDKTSGPGS